MTSRDKVRAFIDQRYHYDRLEVVPVLPGGTMVYMPDGKVCVSYDVLNNWILETFEDGTEKRTPWFLVLGDDPQGYYPGGMWR